MFTAMCNNLAAVAKSVLPLLSQAQGYSLTPLCSNGNRAVGYLQANQVRWKIHNNSYSRYEIEPQGPCLLSRGNRLSGHAGDGIGAEVAESVKTVFKADNVPVEWEQIDVTGVETGDKHSEDLFRESIASLKRNKLGLKGVAL